MTRGYDPSKDAWMNPNLEYLFNAEIVEYDMRDAGFSLIQEFRLLPTKKIQELDAMGKGRQRHIAIGILQRDDPDFSQRLKESFAKMRRFFLEFNDIKDSDIISVKKDAIFTTGIAPTKLRFGRVEFALKNHYTSYVRFQDANSLEVYYHDSVDIKGMGDVAVNSHRLYMVEFLREMIHLIEGHDSRAKRKMMQFIDQFKAGELNEAYYLEFNNMSRKFDPVFNYRKIIIPLLQMMMRELG